MLQGFLASKKVTVLLVLLILVLLAGGSYYIYSQGQEIGRLEKAAQELQERKDNEERKAEQIAKQTKLLEAIQQAGAEQEKRLLAALERTSAEFRRCFDMPVPDSMRIDDGYGDTR